MLVSAAIAGGPPRRVLDAARAGRLELIVPDRVHAELVDVLEFKRDWRAARLSAYLTALDAIVAERPAAPLDAEPLTGDPADDRILACAIEQGANVIVSGNKRHLLSLGASQGVRILTPQALLAELRAKR